MATLTTRQREIVALKAQGMTDRQVALRLCISRHTVKHHMCHARERAGATTIQLAVAAALAQIGNRDD